MVDREPPIRFPRLLFMLSTIEIILGCISLFFLLVVAILAYSINIYRQILTEYWSFIKTAETCLEVLNYLTLLKAGRYGRAAAKPRVGRELNTFYLDFLTWNTMGALISWMQMIIVCVEIAFLEKSTRKIVRYLTIYPVAGITVTLAIQCAAVSLDLIPWSKIWLWNLSLIMARENIRVGRYRNLFREESECGDVPLTAQTSVCSAATTSGGSISTGFYDSDQELLIRFLTAVIQYPRSRLNGVKVDLMAPVTVGNC